MDFGDTTAEAAFRAEAREWIAGAVARLPRVEPIDLDERLAYFRVWQRDVHAAGYAGLSWPVEYGGRGASIMERAIWAEEIDRAGAPDPLNAIGEGFAGPTIVEFGTEQQKRRFLPPILRGDEIWCQLFSEPEAGSDLAGLRTVAERVDGGWEVTGQKVWTSRAQLADHAILLARTGPDRHRGITYFLLPMDQPGVVVRPLRQITGEDEFSETFLERAFVPDGNRLGEVNAGWRIALATLQYERATIALGRINVQRWVDELVELVRAGGPDGPGSDPAIRQRVADISTRATVHRLTALRALTRMAQGEAPGPESSVGKLFMSPLLVDLCELALDVQGLAGCYVDDDGGDLQSATRWQRRALWVRGMALAGGTPQIQRNIVAERVLGLPRA
jgi:alkylation response protein AidB-like acyl-CoA dehydrogenase